MSMTPDQMFDAAMRDVGGKLDCSQLSPSGLVLVEGYHKLASTLIARFRSDFPSLPPIHFGYVGGRDLNAYATEYQGQYYIGVTWGAIVILRLLFMRMLADPNTLSDVGNPTEEKPGHPHLEELCVDMANCQLASTGSLVIGAPQNAERQRFAIAAFESALSFLIRHEIIHILHRHLSHPIFGGSGSCLPELGWNAPTASAAWIRQLMEYAADRHAAYSIGTYFLSHVCYPHAEAMVNGEDIGRCMAEY